ncbi:phosphatidylglycerol lysyltransferase domain-containing protein [Mucilaginibacter sp. L3T2-6]|uniref:phosphatidylglycerol lysyltransferase domain-containing protein n=1 Tax=Mucilaginibacter sp. L3T2-6 TaxID=3062491 RepID=UPI0026744FD4|nr:phosphatidylglycerol lysyltransferase domain-containing protein [Mucilaginibacter sp. L3T2-6]MDO3645027.1 phosphatidylglycerol lysyltransferase domain-containing protein [Mucilaginibacter sp. L3T2-6]MDV6217478.1 phosphatidylglycerol lysyltransferase domain-containing protein [Mucilaginibacter sp. L3T2-6]
MAKKFFVNPRLYLSEITGLLLLILAIYFIRSQGQELKNVGNYIWMGNPIWVTAGVLLTLIYIALQALMYSSSFRALNLELSLWNSTVLFLKRNLISIFLPGGSITSLAFFTKDIVKETNEENRTRIHFASAIYGFTGIVSIIIIAIPVLIYLTLTGNGWKDANQEVAIVIFLIILLTYILTSFFRKGWVYRLISRFFPKINLEFKKHPRFKVHFALVNGYSVLIDLTGVAHLYISMLVTGAAASWEIALIGYVIATLILLISPFLRGIGAIEFSLVVILKHYGYSASEALAVTLIYRFFEFWLPVAAGIISFLLKKGNMVLRVIPAFLSLGLGLVNIISVLTPALTNRLKLLANYLSAGTISASNYMVFIAGLLLIVTSAFLFKGFRNAWRLAVVLCVLSLVGNLTKAFDYEEGIVAAMVLLVLWFTRKQYYIKHSVRLQTIGLGTALLVFCGIIIYGITGFYFLDERHFGIDFHLLASVKHTFYNFILLDVTDLIPRTHFASVFLNTIRIGGTLSVALIFYTLLKPYFLNIEQNEDEFARAKALVSRLGSSPIDYFKTYDDKLLYFGGRRNGLVSFRMAGSFAVVLGQPVCANTEDEMALLEEFEEFCTDSGCRSAYYRVDEESLPLFRSLGKRSLIIGQEAIVDIEAFTLEGKNKKSMRNGLNALKKNGFKTRIYEAPIKDGLLQKLEYVSNDWLKTTHREEIVFTQGLFDRKELKNQTIITLENEGEKVFGFLNIIPDYAPDQATYDLIRKTSDAPGGVNDALIVALIDYCRLNQYKYLNLGLAPLSGIEHAKDLPEKTLKFAYEKLQQFRHYRGLRDFKEKFLPEWQNKYLIYENHYDLISLPNVLSKVMKP